MKVFLAAVGGTGINCLKSFLFVNAISSHGLGEDIDYEILFVDPDSTGSYTDLVESLAGYEIIRSEINEARNEFEKKNKNENIKLNVDQFIPRFSINDKWTIATQLDKRLIELCDSKNVTPAYASEEDLLGVFYEKKHLDMNFSGGFHGIPNVGTLVTKHFMDNDGNAWRNFLEQIAREDNETHIVIMGSVFGGTGAAGIPALMNKLIEEEAYKNAKLHVLLMLPYFKLPEIEDVDPKKVRYELGNMNLNSAYAMEYYESLDKKILEKFSFIMVGQPIKDIIGGDDYEESGQGQKNKAMIAELVASFLVLHSIKESSLFQDGDTDRSMLIMSTYREERAKNGFVNFDGIPYTDGFGKKIAVMKFLAELFTDKLQKIFTRSEIQKEKECTYIFEQRLEKIDEDDLRKVMNFFDHFIKWCDNVNFVNIKGQDELKNILFSFEEENKNTKKEPVYKFKPTSDGIPEDVFPLIAFIEKFNEQVRKSNILTFSEILSGLLSLLTSGSANLGASLFSLGVVFSNFIVNAIKDERVEEE